MTAPAKGRVMQLGDKNDTAPLTMEDNDSETSENDSEDVGVSVLEIASGKLPFLGPGRDKLFIRGFYPKLLAVLRADKWKVLLSNPGVGKSVFQFYYLACLLNPAVLPPDQLPPNHLNSREAPSVIVRQIGADTMQVIFIKEQTVFIVDSKRSIIKSFRPDMTEYWYEPENDRNGPYYGGDSVYMLS
jgi:hypothetical protein